MCHIDLCIVQDEDERCTPWAAGASHINSTRPPSEPGPRRGLLSIARNRLLHPDPPAPFCSRTPARTLIDTTQPPCQPGPHRGPLTIAQPPCEPGPQRGLLSIAPGRLAKPDPSGVSYR